MWIAYCLVGFHITGESSSQLFVSHPVKRLQIAYPSHIAYTQFRVCLYVNYGITGIINMNSVEK